MDKEEKKTFFDELYELDDDVSEEDDASGATAFLMESKTGPSKQGERSRNILASSAQPLVRTISAPLLQQASTSANTIPPRDGITPGSSDALPSADFQAKKVPLASTKSADMSTSRGLSKAGGKRKRGQSFEPKPESQQIFKGLSFFFLPNDDVSPVRKFRIMKAMEFGALWVREWRAGITHIIVDQHICYQDVIKFLGIPSVPPNMVLVSDLYLPDCLTYGCMVNPNQRYYQLSGQESAPAALSSPEVITSPGNSLQLKPERQAGLLQPNTPLRTEGSDQAPSKLDLEASICTEHRQIGNAYARPDQPDALDKAIDEAKVIEDLPLDLDEDEHQGSDEVVDEPDSDRSEDDRRPESRSKKASLDQTWQQSFSCMSKHDGTDGSNNPNARTIEILQKMANHYERHQDHWRLTAYRRAIAALRKQSIKITTAKQAFALPFVGARLADKIEEIVWTNKLRRLDNANDEPVDKVFQLFTQIYGVGFKQAKMWIDQGHQTIQDLLSHASLSKNQKIGIDHLEDFQKRIPRQEMHRHDQYVRQICSDVDASVEITIGGSYRRGTADSGDVDFIITKPDCPIEVLRTIVVESIIPRLFQKEYLKVGLATTARDDGSKWHGAAALPGESVWRRIDFLLVPWNELGAALIYFTGNDIFNRSMRLLASKKGLRLNQHGLWKDVIRGPNRQKITQGTLLEGKSEGRIFELLGVPWRPPHHRECYAYMIVEQPILHA